MGLNCDDEKMAVISSTSTTNEWPQKNNNGTPMIADDHHQKALNTNHHHHPHNMASSTTEAPPIILDKQGLDQQQQQQQHQQALKCPRCDSSNTKFCYYNNYSLSQPRHFCKACKRYWTRGGTLRNVPVGGGCRKNKRLRRPSSASNSSAASAAVDANMPNSSSPNSSSSSLSAVINSHPCSTANHSLQGPIDLSSPGITSLIYNNHDHVGLPFSRFSTTVPSASGYDHLALQPQLSALGLGFAGGETNGTAHDTNYLNGLFCSNNSLLSSYGSIFSTTTTSSMASPTIASLLASKFANGGTLKDQASGGSARVSLSHFQALAPFDELHIDGIRSGHEAVGMSFSMNNNNNNNKQVVKSEDGQAAGTRALDWINGGGGASGCTDPNQTDQIGLLSSDPSLYWTNPTAVGGANWHDPANIGSNSVPSMI